MIYNLNKEVLLKSFFAISVSTIMIFLFNNMTKTDSILPFQLESQKISKEINKSNISKNAKSLLIQHKKFITGLIASKSKAQNCDDLMKADPFMVTGQYIIKSKTDKKFYYLHCEIKNSKITKSKVVAEFKPNSNNCINKKSCLTVNKIYKNIECKSTNEKINFCNFPMLIDKPTLFKEISKNICVRGKTYGVNLNGIWVDKGCHATFKVAEIPITEEFITPQRKVLGFLDSVELDGSSLVVKGWACQFGESKPVFVNFYVKGKKGVGQLVHWAKSDKPSSSLISKKCGVASTNHRFETKIPVTSTISPNDLLFVEAVSNFKTHNNDYIERSGLVSVGNVNSITGAVVIESESRNIKVSGWACVVGGTAPISVRIDSITNNSHADVTSSIATIPVDKPSDNLVKKICKGTLSAHHFSTTIVYPDTYFYGGLGISATVISSLPNPMTTRNLGTTYIQLENSFNDDKGR